MYNLKDSQRKKKAEAVIEKLKDEHAKNQKDEIFEEDEDNTRTTDKFNEMRETKTGFGAKSGAYQAEGGLQPEDESEGDEEEDVEEDEEGDDGIDQDDEDDEESDHNF